MSDLLSRMIERATRGGGGIVPVTSSMYESVPYGARTIAGFSNDPAGAGEADAPTAVRPERRQRRFVPASEPGEPRVELPAAAADEPRSDRPIRRHRDAPTAEPAHLEAFSPPERSRVFAAIERVPQAPAMRPQPPAEKSEPPAQVAATVHDIVEVRQPAHLPAMVPRDEPVRTQPRRTHPPLAPAEQPVEVHVSIGHIEIRRAAPPPPPAPRRSPVPHVTLEEYLKRRRGDAR